MGNTSKEWSIFLQPKPAERRPVNKLAIRKKTEFQDVCSELVRSFLSFRSNFITFSDAGSIKHAWVVERKCNTLEAPSWYCVIFILDLGVHSEKRTYVEKHLYKWNK